jgi:hypothetical protein
MTIEAIIDFLILFGFLYILYCQIRAIKTTVTDNGIVRYIYILCSLIFITLTCVLLAIDLGIAYIWLEYWIARSVLLLLACVGIFLFKIYKPK